jgi:hypothetical protein
MLEIIKEHGFVMHHESKPSFLLFLICDDCYWCASAIKSVTITKCPQCEKMLTIMMPLSMSIQEEEEGPSSVWSHNV